MATAYNANPHIYIYMHIHYTYTHTYIHIYIFMQTEVYNNCKSGMTTNIAIEQSRTKDNGKELSGMVEWRRME